ncbi:uncharacterized protein A4U43_C10F16010 [Asparagus officinalis]|uniref:J domain-containing protein n=1 Tax=Asparagus officinalis TaxID=4686 RepID=A0A5P1E4Z2_ASPOF|nr:uncharacterized protein A4U43_C10F16010 [Asparagus officinalis]
MEVNSNGVRVDRVPVNQSGVLDLSAGSSKSSGPKGVLDRVPVDVQLGFLDLNAGSSKFQSPRSKGVLDLSKLKSPGSNGDLSKRQFSGFLDSNGGVLKSPGSNGDLSKRQFPGFLDSNGVLDRNKQSTGSSSSVRVSWADEVDLRKDKEDFQLNSPFSLNTDQAVEEASTILNSVMFNDATEREGIMDEENVKIWRAREAIKHKMRAGDYIGARALILEALKAFPTLDHASGMLTLLASASPAAVEARYQKIVTQLKLIKNDCPGTELALNFAAANAFSVLSDPINRAEFDSKRSTFEGLSQYYNSVSSYRLKRAAGEVYSGNGDINENQKRIFCDLEASCATNQVNFLDNVNLQKALGVLEKKSRSQKATGGLL